MSGLRGRNKDGFNLLDAGSSDSEQEHFVLPPVSRNGKLQEAKSGKYVIYVSDTVKTRF